MKPTLSTATSAGAQAPTPGAGWLEVTGDAARFLMNPADARYLTPFLSGAYTLSEAAARLGVRRDTLLHRIRRMQALGLLTMEETGAGSRPVKRYRASALGFVAKFQHSQAASVHELFMARDRVQRDLLGTGLLAALAGQSGWHLRIFHDHASGITRWAAAPDDDPEWDIPQMLAPDAPAAWYTNVTLTLTAAQAKALQRTLARMYQEAVQSATPGEPLYTLQLGLAPVAMSPTGG